MKDAPDRRRLPIRLRGYDYRQAGEYFVTICTQDRLCLFGEVVDGHINLNDAGRMVEKKQQGWPAFPGKLWQRSYYERIVRHEDELNTIRQYIIDNPARWEMDREYPAARMGLARSRIGQ